MSKTTGDLVESRPLPEDVDRAIRAAVDNPARAEAVLTLAAIANRAIAALHTVARSEANARRGAEDWGAWASLANAARDAVLKMATCRKVATDLARKSGGSGAERA